MVPPQAAAGGISRRDTACHPIRITTGFLKDMISLMAVASDGKIGSQACGMQGIRGEWRARRPKTVSCLNPGWLDSPSGDQES